MSIEKTLYNFRKVNNYSQEEAAQILGVSQVTFHYWESGIYRPSDKNLKKIASVCGGNIDSKTFEDKEEELDLIRNRIALLEQELKKIKEANNS